MPAIDSSILVSIRFQHVFLYIIKAARNEIAMGILSVSNLLKNLIG